MTVGAVLAENSKCRGPEARLKLPCEERDQVPLSGTGEVGDVVCIMVFDV